ncbi:hypothetical protein INT44_005072 [Umbelopsis vinacea]|uniref:Laccase n=1 Tax=Umbelopsis vinacea TaxID=44442 RepID=A0A8H7UIQ6_9FUNG|nr:hypothetical protein INT44_005072 [Umbelopsis vinacea]
MYLFANLTTCIVALLLCATHVNAAHIREYFWTVRNSTMSPDGVSRTLLTVNGQFPGPKVEANHGDVIRVHVTNLLDEPTSIHWHGITQRNTPYEDGVVGVTNCPIPAGRRYVYEFNTTGSWGTFWWHSHSGAQYTDGLYGPLVIHNPEAEPYINDYDEERVLMLSDYYHVESPTMLRELRKLGALESFPDNVIINGKNNVNCDLLDVPEGRTCESNGTNIESLNFEPGKRYRLRLLNTGTFANTIFSIDNHTLTIIEADGTDLKKYTVDRITLHVGQRYSVIVEANQTPQNYYMRAELDRQCFYTPGVVLVPELPKAIGTVRYVNGTDTYMKSKHHLEDTDRHCQDMDPSALENYYPQAAPSYSQSITLSMRFGKNKENVLRGFLNNVTFNNHPNSPTLLNMWSVQDSLSGDNLIYHIEEPQYIQLVIQGTPTGNEHPFHLHGQEFYLMGTGTGTYNYTKHEYLLNYVNPVRRDVATIPPRGWAIIRFYAHPGVWFFHCHMDWHLEAGLAVQFVVMPQAIQNLTIPDKVLDQCTSIDYAYTKRAYLAGQDPMHNVYIEELKKDKPSQGWDDNVWKEEHKLMADVSFRRTKLLRVGDHRDPVTNTVEMKG